MTKRYRNVYVDIIWNVSVNGGNSGNKSVNNFLKVA